MQCVHATVVWPHHTPNLVVCWVPVSGSRNTRIIYYSDHTYGQIVWCTGLVQLELVQIESGTSQTVLVSLVGNINNITIHG